jgi:hypothetical protein
VEFLYKQQISFLLKKQLSLVSQQIINKKVLVNTLPNRNLPNQNTEGKKKNKKQHQTNKQTTRVPGWGIEPFCVRLRETQAKQKHSKGQRTLPPLPNKSLPSVPKDGNMAT